MPQRRKSIKIERSRHGSGYTVRANDPNSNDIQSWDVGYVGTYQRAKEEKKRHQNNGLW
jgi:hypothetical protein